MAAATLGSKAHYDLMEAFERAFKGLRLDKEAKDMWAKGYVYQHGEVNQLFLAFRRGVEFGRTYCQ
jgi:hypothetical protein